MPRGRGRGPQMSNEKAKDFKGTMKKLMAYLSAYKIGIFFVIVFAIGSTIFNIVSQPNRPTEKKLSIVRPTCSAFYGARIKIQLI